MVKRSIGNLDATTRWEYANVGPTFVTNLYMKYFHQLVGPTLYKPKYLQGSYPLRTKYFPFIIKCLFAHVKWLVAKNDIERITLFQFIINDYKIMTHFNLFNFKFKSASSPTSNLEFEAFVSFIIVCT